MLLTQSWVEAEITKGRLEAEGIPVHVEGVAEGPYPTGPSELFVPSSFESQARRVIDDVRNGAYELDEAAESDTPQAPPASDG